MTFDGCVAFVNSEREIGWIRKESCSHGMEDFSRGVTLCPELPLSNYSHRLKATNCNLCSSKFREAHGSSASQLDRPMVLFNDIIQILILAWPRRYFAFTLARGQDYFSTTLKIGSEHSTVAISLRKLPYDINDCGRLSQRPPPAVSTPQATGRTSLDPIACQMRRYRPRHILDRCQSAIGFCVGLCSLCQNGVLLFPS